MIKELINWIKDKSLDLLGGLMPSKIYVYAFMLTILIGFLQWFGNSQYERGVDSTDAKWQKAVNKANKSNDEFHKNQLNKLTNERDKWKKEAEELSAENTIETLDDIDDIIENAITESENNNEENYNDNDCLKLSDHIILRNATRSRIFSGKE